ncbi:MAG: hypothetical protein M3Y54_14545 [Bacteroidota bacterium]|nr:hypothetical protein [Bacteroidota bacterium]
MKQLFTLLLIASSHICAKGQQIVDVADLTLRLGGNETKELYYNFAKDDQITFNFEVSDHKTVKEIDVTEMATGTKRYEDYESALIKDKILLVNQKGVYKFRIYNSSLLKGRICKVRIQRKPGTEATIKFNTAVKWIEKSDTTYNVYSKKVVTGYHNYDVQKSRKVIARIDTIPVTIINNRVERVHSVTNTSSPNFSDINFSFPQNSFEPNAFNPYKTTEVISWAYVLSTGDTGAAWYKDANKRAIGSSLIKTAVAAGAVSAGTGAVAVLAIYGASMFSNPPSGDNVIFSFIFSQNGQNYLLREGQGNSVVVNGRVTSLKQGGMTLRLTNDNTIDAINVDVKIVATVLTKTYKDENYTVMKSDPIEEVKTFRDPVVTVRKMPVATE